MTLLDTIYSNDCFFGCANVFNAPRFLHGKKTLIENDLKR